MRATRTALRWSGETGRVDDHSSVVSRPNRGPALVLFVTRPRSQTRTDEQVITRLRTLKGSPLDLALAVEVLEAYIEAKRRKGRDEAGVAKRLEAIRHAVRLDSTLWTS